jgi:hypothetical protein
MLPFANFALMVRRMHDIEEHEPFLPQERGSLLLTLIPIALTVLWAVVLFR